ncbi:MAG: PAS domain S-box protein, partial [Gammaproteobacteria bacterium]|nr:PAS domain S-box protein [Gammaproteobacteria bacterium]
MSGSFDPVLVALSFVVAVVASYTALGLARKVAETSGFVSTFWLIAGAASMGIGIWTMHFVGMLAFSMEMPFTYDVNITILSLLAGIGASGFAIYVGSLKSVSNLKIGLSGIILGAGIATMHYLGMAAMKMQATIHYDTFWVGVSIVIAVVAATAAIWIAFTLARRAEHGLFKLKMIAAFVMGIAICGMHYTGMIAASYEPLRGVVMDHTGPVQQTWLAVSIAIAALVILGVTHLTIFFDYRLSAQKLIGEQAEQEAFRLSEILDD